MRMCLDWFGSNKFDSKILGLVVSELVILKVVQLWSDACNPADIERHVASMKKGRVAKESTE